ncbi:MAG TPA: coenzyme F420-0:L-glutamate ligase [Methanothermococcus okinawensis]|uniref:Coenzyme F420-0:L-glutamate ligase n=1 Tax=Methanothermococcus okinawensis TaxID=155863 RepID=A0A832ZGW3_9EURY|nr:coenzyme F420-0:L-glutamate ligase [Methanococcaceae archaeon]HIP84200.1 coenzyme F420-0:L-glutamate ligase [Methanothermococcus okinawensis]HIP90994.1 coenzyme F420-0:L-glutamate ligase [Methanothermococcus okinawensis]
MSEKYIREKRRMELIGLEIPVISEGDNLGIEYLADLLSSYSLRDGDIVVVAETLISKLEGNTVKKEDVKLTPLAYELAEKLNKPPEVVQVILDEAKEIVKIGDGFIITETKHGFVCANSGVDESNIKDGIKPLPEDPDRSASILREMIERKTGKRIGVIISDSIGRPFRRGACGVAIGVSGISALWDRRGERDLFNRPLKSTEVAIGDELASAASILMGESNEGIPVVIVRNAPVPFGDGKGKDLIRSKEEDVFREDR